LLLKNGKVQDPSVFLRLLMEREEMTSTVIAKGIAVPHVRNIRYCPVRDSCIAMGICKEG
jgi:mannitol/fructose-specific phosphotransferase system IIA component (Ntr-type)